VGRYLPAPVERVRVPARVAPGQPSSPMLVAALTAAIGTSVMALFIHHDLNRRP
jgi:hypothetical protein